MASKSEKWETVGLGRGAISSLLAGVWSAITSGFPEGTWHHTPISSLEQVANKKVNNLFKWGRGSDQKHQNITIIAFQIFPSKINRPKIYKIGTPPLYLAVHLMIAWYHQGIIRYQRHINGSRHFLGIECRLVKISNGELQSIALRKQKSSTSFWWDCTMSMLTDALFVEFANNLFKWRIRWIWSAPIFTFLDRRLRPMTILIVGRRGGEVGDMKLFCRRFAAAPQRVRMWGEHLETCAKGKWGRLLNNLGAQAYTSPHYWTTSGSLPLPNPIKFAKKIF